MRQVGRALGRLASGPPLLLLVILALLGARGALADPQAGGTSLCQDLRSHVLDAYRRDAMVLATPQRRALPGGAQSTIDIAENMPQSRRCVRAFIVWQPSSYDGWYSQPSASGEGTGGNSGTSDDGGGGGGTRIAATAKHMPELFVAEVTREGQGQSRVVVDVPTAPPGSSGWLLHAPARLFVAAVAEGENGDRLAFVGVVNGAQVTLRATAVVAASAVVLLFYLAMAFAVWRRWNTSRGYKLVNFLQCLNPVLMTAGYQGRASLSKLQILFFTLIVAGLLTYFVARTWTLSDLSTDVLLLLGIAGLGTSSGKVTARVRNRVSYANWTWMVDRGWIARNQGEKTDSPPLWSELVMQAGEFDVTRFQMLVFSFIVGLALLLSGLSGLADFEIPGSLLGLLGLSQAAYVGGKTLGPPSWKELDKKLGAVRDAEGEVQAAVGQLECLPADAAKAQAAARKAAPDAYSSFEQAQESAREMVMLQYAMTSKPPALAPRLPQLPPCPEGSDPLDGGSGGA